jgi:hypothetical protein
LYEATAVDATTYKCLLAPKENDLRRCCVWLQGVRLQAMHQIAFLLIHAVRQSDAVTRFRYPHKDIAVRYEVQFDPMSGSAYVVDVAELSLCR